MKKYILLVLIIAFFTGCPHEHAPHVAQTEPLKITVWTPKTEIFMEYNEPVAGEQTGFLIHLTDLKNFKPVTEGVLILTFTHSSGEATKATIDAPSQPGIFKSDVVFKKPGIYRLQIVVKGKTLSDELDIPGIEVFNVRPARLEEKKTEDIGAISLTKEQQWAVDFMVKIPERKNLSSSFVAMGELAPVSHAEITVSSPLSGIASASKPLPFAGKRVSRGDVLAVIEPPIEQPGGMGQLTSSYVEAKNRFILAQNEYGRAKRLYEAKAVPKRRLDEAEISLSTARAALDPLEKAMRDIKNSASDNKLIVRAPISGTIVEVMTSNGRFIEAGQPIVRIINTSTLWLKANIPVTKIGNIKRPDMAAFTIAGVVGEFKPARLITVSDMVDPRSRTVPVIFEVNNQRGIFKVGMFANVSIKTGVVKDALTLPEIALFEDEGRHFVFTQRTGESFERREVKTGIRDGDYVQIVAGIKEGKRVVTKGGYYVRLASMSARMPVGHGHDHGHDHGHVHGHDHGHVH